MFAMFKGIEFLRYSAKQPINQSVYDCVLGGVHKRGITHIQRPGGNRCLLTAWLTTGLQSLILGKGNANGKTGVRVSLLLFSISTEASASVNTLKCFVAVRNIDL